MSNRMPLAECIINGLIRVALHVACRVDAAELEKIPARGPAIMVTNHTTNWEGPIYYVLLGKRPRTALGKEELWRHPVTRFFMQLWSIIPLNRRGTDRRALSRARRALERGYLLGIAPEGTRSSSGTLQRGRPGAAMIATAARVPLIPMVQWGIQDLGKNVRRFRRTALHVRVGTPFYLGVPEGSELGTRDLRRMADEIMYQLAVLLPEEFRGFYRDLSAMTETYIVREAAPE